MWLQAYSFAYLKDDRDPSVPLRCNDVREEEDDFVRLRAPAGAFAFSEEGSGDGCSTSSSWLVDSGRETTPPCLVRMVLIAG